MNRTILALIVMIGLTSGCESMQMHMPGGSNRGVYSVKSFGAKGDGQNIDSRAINAAIDHVAANGGGTVYFPPGSYLSYSIRLKSKVALYLEQGATILAAQSPTDERLDMYDPPEANPWDKYQDFGHTHWHNSLIWGENLTDISILGPGMIDGKGLSRGQRPTTQPASRPAELTSAAPTWPDPLPAPAADTNNPNDPNNPTLSYPNARDSLPTGIGNKAIALKLCRNVIIRDVTIFRGGHFAILATGVDNFTLDGVKIDTNRDGVDLDCCQNVRMSNCTVNSPSDDGICPKSSFALGYNRATENVTITNCQVSGYDMGTLLDGTYKRSFQKTLSSGPTGRIKFGTESNGGFKNITINNCVFSYCRGLALETVDGANLEDVTISNITMRDVWSSAFFIRLGARARGPNEPPPGTLKRVHIDNVVVYNSAPLYSSIISGIPGADIEDLRLSNIRIVYQGGGPRELATSQPAERIREYPEPRMFGMIPAYGFYIRHVKGLEMANITLSYMNRDFRPAFILEDVKDAEFENIKAQHETDVPTFVLKNVENFTARQVEGVADVKKDRVESEQLHERR
ncbi:MAG TPA: glycoside hydrolase family 28 protein [Tepidisphaeraceae bacterium]|nr:glycoside hydrolase family 28 protein [Tepidisphaeraceae bacterium]